MGIMFEPKPIEVVQLDDEVRVVSKPYVTLVSFRLLDQGVKLSVWGYRRVEVMTVIPAVLYARPLPLWLIAKAKERVRVGLFNLVRWAFQHGLVHLACSEGVLPRWRDWRPGSGSDR